MIDWVHAIPVRLYRILRHLAAGLGYKWESPFNGEVLPHNQNFSHRLLAWWGVLLIYLLELIGTGEIYETINDFLKINTRVLTREERKIAQSIFGSQLNYWRIRIDDAAFIGPKQQSICYVSFYIVNSWGPMSNPLLIHELSHVWQYESMGAVYMIKALLAQHSREGYNYGGVRVLAFALAKEQTVLDFNLEQQGDIIADYYRLKNNLPPTWGRGTPKDLDVYKKILKTLH